MDHALVEARKSPTTLHPDLQPADVYRKHLHILKSKNSGAELFKRVKSFAAVLYKKKFEDAVLYDNWQARINELCGHHLATFGYPPNETLFKAAQNVAFALGKIPVAEELYRENYRILTGYYHDPTANNLDRKLPEHVDDIKRDANEFIHSVLTANQDHALLVHEHLDVPSGLEAVIEFCIQQLLIRDKHIVESIRLVSTQRSSKRDMNFYIVTFASAITVKRLMISVCLRRLVDIRAMAGDREKRVALGDLATLIVYHRFTNKLPNELLAHLQHWEPLSPFWIYCHAKLDAILMNIGRVKHMQRLNESLQQHVLYEAMTYGRLILAMRSVASEPVHSHLPHVIFEEESSAECRVIDLARGAMQKHMDTYNQLGFRNELTLGRTKSFFETGLNAGQSCLNHPVLARAKPLSFAELAQITPRVSENKTTSLKDDWFADPEPKPKQNRRRKKRKQPLAKTLSAIAEDESNAEAESDPSTGDDSLDSAGSVLTGTSSSAEEMSISSSPISSSPMSSSPVSGTISESMASSGSMSESPPSTARPLDFAALLAPTTIEVEYDPAAAQLSLRAFQQDLALYEEQRRMAQYEYDAIRDAAKTLAVTPAPEQYSRQQHTVEFFSTNDFLGLHPEASEAYHRNMYNGLALLAQSDPSLRLEWVFVPGVVIGQETFRFLCQVFNLDPGTNLLTFANFVRAFDKLTLSSKDRTMAGRAMRTSRPVFRFTHAFTVEGRVCLPPMEEIHREHESSGFNWKRVKAFLTHGGAHPYFFRVVRSKYRLD